MAKTGKKLLFVLLACLFCAAIAAGIPAAFAAEGDDEIVYPTYTQDFSDAAAVNEDFTAGYVNALGNNTNIEQVYNDGQGDGEGHWFINAEGQLERRGDINADAGTWRAAILTYNKQLYTNFELEVDYKQGTQTFWWTCVAFRQTEIKSFFDDGAGIFVQQGGQMTMWGAVGVGGPYEKPAISDYDRDAWHHMRLRVQGNSAELYVDEYPVAEWTLNGSFYREGYVSLISINNDSMYDNFKLTELPEPEEPELPPIPPIDEADSDDALGNIAAAEDDKLPVERPLDYQDDYTLSENGNGGNGGNENPPSRGGCGSSVAGGVGLLGAASVAASAAIIRRKRS